MGLPILIALLGLTSGFFIVGVGARFVLDAQISRPSSQR